MSGMTTTGPVLWIDDDVGTIGTVDVATDAVTVIGSSGAALTDIAFNPTDALYGIGSAGLYSIDKATGAATSIGSFGVSSPLNGLVFSASGTLCASGGSDLYTIDTRTGAAALVESGAISLVRPRSAARPARSWCRIDARSSWLGS